ncbi:hypothetical protein EIP91_011350 [Steccherinum ochraceum]|uniref:Uncharacterized protein n=1 Tax=Steccherinum ochraceum TaxID=92696 RepID=A0A4V2MUT5_9APHY|nr:hypothetical protein EIP91_011350 [Steccherinum ochraceum]
MQLQDQPHKASQRPQRHVHFMPIDVYSRKGLQEEMRMEWRKQYINRRRFPLRRFPTAEIVGASGSASAIISSQDPSLIVSSGQEPLDDDMDMEEPEELPELSPGRHSSTPPSSLTPSPRSHNSYHSTLLSTPQSSSLGITTIRQPTPPGQRYTPTHPFTDPSSPSIPDVSVVDQATSMGVDRSPLDGLTDASRKTSDHLDTPSPYTRSTHRLRMSPSPSPENWNTRSHAHGSSEHDTSNAQIDSGSSVPSHTHLAAVTARSTSLHSTSVLRPAELSPIADPSGVILGTSATAPRPSSHQRLTENQLKVKKGFRNFSKAEGCTRWYKSTSTSALDVPPQVEGTRLADIYVHLNVQDGSWQLWIMKEDGQWAPASRGYPHPMLQDRFLNLRSDDCPSWVRWETLQKYKGEERRKEQSS